MAAAAAAPPASPPGPASSPGPSSPPGPRSPPPPPPSRCRRRPGRARRDVVRPRRREGGGGAAGAAQAAGPGPGPGPGAEPGASGAPGPLFRAPWPRRGGGGAGPGRARGGGGVEREQPRGRGPGGPVRLCRQSLPCRRRRLVLRAAPPRPRRGMAERVPPFPADGGRALLMPPEPSPEPGFLLQDPKTGTRLEEDAFYGTEEEPAAAGPQPGEEPSDFFSSSSSSSSSLARHEPDVAMEAHDEADEPDPALSGAVPAAAHRTQLGPVPEEQPAFPRALFRPLPAAASWGARPARGTDQSTLEPRPGPGHSPGSAGHRPETPDSGHWVGPPDGHRLGPPDSGHWAEPLDWAEPPDGHRAEPPDGHQAEPPDGRWAEAADDGHRAEAPDGRWAEAPDDGHRAEAPPSPEEKHPQKEPKHPEGLGGVQRLEWISRSPSPSFQAPGAPGSASGREAAPASRRAKAKTAESGRRKAEPAATAEWTLPKLDVVVAKQSWTVNAEDSVERLLPEAGEAARPYVCGVLLEEPPKDEELEPEESPPSVFTCIECSIYFRRKEHLLEHMLQHTRSADAPACRFCCGECGWAFAEPAALERHRRLHQESREKIIEEIQKLNEFPDEGREARLQCPKCVFGTNSSKIFVQHAKMHVKERKESASRSSNLFGDGAGHGLYKPFQAEELPAAPSGKAPSACVLCGFPAPTEHILKEHLRYAHSHFSWQPEGFEEDPNQPGTSRGSYSPTRPGRFADAEAFGKTERSFSERLLPGASSIYDPTPATFGHPRLDKSHQGATKKELHGFQHARKAAPYSHQSLASAGFSSPKGFSHSALQQLRKRAATPQLEGDGDNPRGHHPALEELRHRWAVEEVEPGDARAAGGAVTVPRAALELKRTFRAALRATDPAVASEEQRQQLRMTVPVVVLEEMSAHPRAAKRPRGKPLKKKLLPARGEFLLEEPPLPLDVLLLDAPLEGPLELEELLDSEATMLKNEERKCPYCPDRFHNGIGLANHVRGHLNRVGVSYNVRHFISAEEVKAIEQKFSFQKKKKKGMANFDPGTFSLMRCEFCGAGFDTRAGLSSHARAHLRDFGITNWELTVSPIHILKELLATAPEHPALLRAMGPSPGRDLHGFGFLGSIWGLGFWDLPKSALFPLPWGDEVLQPYRDVLAPDEDELVAMEVTSPPPIPKKSSARRWSRPPPRLGTKLSPEPPGSKAEPQDAKASSLTTCEVCGACFETRKGLSSHARSHLRQLGVAESESSGAPIDLLYELVRHKPKAEGPALAKKSAGGSPKEPAAPRPPLLLLPKPEGSLNKAIKSPPGFAKALGRPGSPALRKVPAPLPGSPKGGEEKGAKLALSPMPAEGKWAPDEDGPLNLTSGSEPCRDIRCEFCGEFFENRKGLSSHARSHLRQMGVTEWYVNGSPIDTLREILTRRRSGHPKPLAKSLLGGLAPLEPPRAPPELHLPPALGKKVPAPLSPPGPAPGAASSPPPPAPPTARKMFPGLSAPSLQKKLKQDQLRVEIKRELMAGAGAGGGGGAGIHPGEAPAPPDPAWAAHEEMAPLNLSSRADPVRDIRCEFCGEFFENRKGLSSHARSHLRQMGVTEWSVNGSPIDTLREILRKKSKPCLIKKEPPLPPGLEPGPGLCEEEPKAPPGPAPGKALPPGLALGKPGSGLALAPLGSKNAPGAFLAAKRPLGDTERLGGHGEAKHKGFELGFKAKALHDKACDTSAEACCELCGLYFENRKALASHARAHLRQFGVTEWCVNGSPIETLREWIRHRPHKAGAYRSYIQGGRPFSKKFRSSAHPREPRGALAVPFLPKGGLAAEAALGECGKGPEGAERALGTPLGVVKVEEQRGNFSKFERRQARALEAPLPREAEPGAAEFPRKLPEPRPPPRVRPVPALVPRPPQTSLVKFVGNIYTLKCRFCEVQFQGPLSIQEEWVRHLQRHILDMNFSKADPLRSEAPPEPPALPEAP
ncbi:LOW QUALITY PROTEIN: protein Wiz [Agelaius tricolor]|uniref:LOW QUALITY PROTEIN: protein Wiz n=1 Tax=Agelaius tricolor TaxID=9191 RepID=UPI0039F250DD